MFFFCFSQQLIGTLLAFTLSDDSYILWWPHFFLLLSNKLYRLRVNAYNSANRRNTIQSVCMPKQQIFNLKHNILYCLVNRNYIIVVFVIIVVAWAHIVASSGITLLRIICDIYTVCGCWHFRNSIFIIRYLWNKQTHFQLSLIWLQHFWYCRLFQLKLKLSVDLAFYNIFLSFFSRIKWNNLN